MKKPDDERVMASNPFEEEEDVLAHSFYNPGPPPAPAPPVPPPAPNTDSSASSSRQPKLKPPKPAHYKTVSISLYIDDIERIDSLVRELKRRGFTKMNRSALIRFAIDTVDIDDMPRQY